ncbi:tetratricopeptide repeat protein [Flavobacterium sp. 3HN19-14]|uniref:tetratricopeptide repeat protein n=1 Tax=Flavobacterium sp. 3HN19-14 TaxID=3448133 RepID=UPI003EE1461B
MNATDYTYILNKPATIQERHTLALEKIMDEFPFFQSARALHLKGLYNADSFKYNQALKVTAAHTTDRSVLFDFITAGQFTGLQHAFLEEKEARINAILVNESEVVAVAEKPEVKVNSLEQSILTSIKEATPEVEIITEEIPATTEAIETKLEIGKPLEFSKEETHSFQEWLQLASFKPIERENIPSTVTEIIDEKQKKIDLIDKFIEANPKIPQIKDVTPLPVITSNSEDTSYLMTETLAKVYLEQKKYQKAIQAYEILILKYPEKSSLFADRISDIKLLQQNNN